MFEQTISPPRINEQDKVIVFDSVCKLCNRSSRFIIKHDQHRQIKLCAIQSNAGIYLSEHHRGSGERPDAVMYSKDGQYFIKSEAVLELLIDLGCPWRLLGIFRLLPLSLRDWCYDLVARNRYRVFGKYDRCRLPNADHQDRYL